MIRQATAEDGAQIAAIYNYYVDNTFVTFETEPVSDSEMQSRITDGLSSYPWLVAKENGTVLGYAFATEWKSRSAYRLTAETTIYLDQDHLGQGVGLALYRQLIDTLRDRGLHCALGGIALPNPASVALHEKLGFRKVGELEQVGWKLEQWVNVGYWELML